MSTAPLLYKLVPPPTPWADCILWFGSRNSRGYPKFSNHYIHRAAYEALHGPIPKGMDVCHRCDVPRCVNPDHLFLGSRADNMKDMVLKGRGRNGFSEATHCIHGHPFSGENLAFGRNYKGWMRRCRTCARDRRLRLASKLGAAEAKPKRKAKESE